MREAAAQAQRLRESRALAIRLRHEFLSSLLNPADRRDLEDLHGLRAAFDVDLADGFGRAPRVEALAGRLRDDDVVAHLFGLALEPRREVHGVADHGVLHPLRAAD